jgi:predicted AlkP superfamily pyrophosphatase or phosphodiesterase
VQARAPFILSGAGVPDGGTLDRSARMIDVAPTFLRLLGTAPHPAGVGPTGAARPDALLARQDGDALGDLVEEGGAAHLVVFLLDGCNANVLYRAIAQGTAPNVATLAGEGTTLGRGLMASFPTATLANHTTASTGVHPGHSGVLHNMWFDRDTLVTPDLLSLDQVFDAMCHLGPDVETLHEAIHRDDPSSFTAAVYELCDRGADFSSFSTIRDGHLPMLPQADQLAGATREFVDSSGAYSFVSSVDELATRQTIDLWERAHGNPLPRFTFLSFSLTDEAGHEAGPYAPMTSAAIADCDARIGRVVDAVVRAGATERTAFAVIADHGMELSDPANTTSWLPALTALEASDPAIASIRDVADGLIYVATS